MAEIINTANSHKTSTLVSGQIPNFVHEDHPLFVQFIESYYEFLAQANSGILTSDGTAAYYGADYATKIIPDASDVDTTDFDMFLESFRRQYAPNFPQSTHANVNDRTLYKNLIDFYRAVGTDDSFKMLFRLLYNEEIEIYYPKTDVLIASGGNYSKQKRISVVAVDNLSNIATINKKIIGETSGAYGTIERVEILPKTFMNFRSGRIANVSSSASFTSANTTMEAIYDPDYLREIQLPRAYLYLTSVVGNFEFHETLYVDDATFANTILLPQTDRILFYDLFDTRDLDGTINSANAVISINSGRSWRSENSTGPPWGMSSNNLEVGASTRSAYISYGNTGMWFSSEGTGQIALVANVAGATGSKVLQIGNNSISALDANLSVVASTYGSFPAYGQANGIGGLGATGNVSFVEGSYQGGAFVAGGSELTIHANTTSEPFIGPTGNTWSVPPGTVSPSSDIYRLAFPDHTNPLMGTANASIYVMYAGGNNVERFINTHASAPAPDGRIGYAPFGVLPSHNFKLVMWDDRPTTPLPGTGSGWGQTWRFLHNTVPSDDADQIYGDNWPSNTVPFIPDSSKGDFIIAQIDASKLSGGAFYPWKGIYDFVVPQKELPKTAYFDEKRRLTFTGDQRHLVLNHNIGIGGEDRLYRMTVRARDLGGNSAISVPEGNRFSAGLECLGRNLNIISANNYNDAWGNSHWFVSDHQSIDDTWFTYIGHFKGRQSKRSSDLISYIPENRGSGGRHDLPVAGKHYNSLSDAIDGNVRLPYGTTFIRPALRINEPSPDAAYSQGITQIDYVQIEELTPIQSQFGIGGEYLDDASLLSTRGAFLQDNLYRQTYAYDIRSKQQVKNYESIVKSTTHPAGLKMFGTTISESSRRTSDMIDLVPSNVRNISNDITFVDDMPSWSPDGTQIAFSSNEYDPSTSNTEIYIMNEDGTGRDRITTHEQLNSNNNWYPSWSPDGTQIVYNSRPDRGLPHSYSDRSICRINVDKTNFKQLIIGNQDFAPGEAVFSPDGKRIAFCYLELDGSGGWASPYRSAIATMNASDGGNVKLVSPLDKFRNSLSWSPDGTQIAFRKQIWPEDGSSPYLGTAIYSTDPDSSEQNETEIWFEPGEHFMYPSWSGRGDMISVHSGWPDRPWDIYALVNVNTKDVRKIQLTSNTAVPFNGLMADWSADGTKIAFGSNRNHADYATAVPALSGTDLNSSEIYVMDVSQPRSDTNLSDTFSPDSLDSLAGWFKAESISPENVDNLRYTTNVVGTHTVTNIMPPGISDFPGTGSPIENRLTLASPFGPAPGFTASIDYGDWAVGSPSSLKIQTPDVYAIQRIDFGDNIYTNLDDYNIILPVANTSWLFSCYIKTSNVVPSVGILPTGTGLFKAFIYTANTSNPTTTQDFDMYYSHTSGVISQPDTWTRVSAVLDMAWNSPNNPSSHFPGANKDRRAMLSMDFPNPNTTYHLDGLMLERYDASVHGTYPNYTPSPYVHPSLNGADVMSWNDSSPNKLHAYANTSMVFGSQWKPPMFIANTGTGHPVVSFRSNNVSYGGGGLINRILPSEYSMFQDETEYDIYSGGVPGDISKLPIQVFRAAQSMVGMAANVSINTTMSYPTGTGGSLQVRCAEFTDGTGDANFSGSVEFRFANALPTATVESTWNGDWVIDIPKGRKWIFSYYIRGNHEGLTDYLTNPYIIELWLRNSQNRNANSGYIRSSASTGPNTPVISPIISAADTWERKSCVLDFSNTTHDIGGLVSYGIDQAPGFTAYFNYSPLGLGASADPLYTADIDSIIIGGGARWNYGSRRVGVGNTMWYAGFQLEEVAPTTTEPSRFLDPDTPTTVYPYTTFPNDQNYMTGLTGKTSPAANTLPRPIANAFTGFVVARTNLSQHPYNYGLAGSVWPQSSMSLFNVGQRNHLAYGSSTNLTSNGAYDLRLVPSFGHGGYYTTYVANSAGWENTIYPPQGESNPLYSNSAFRIHAMSENATTRELAMAEGKSDDLLTFNFNGSRWSARTLGQSAWRTGPTPATRDLSSDRLDYAHQLRQGSTFSIGHALDQNYDSAFRAHSWFDGDIAEILWFNEQLNQEQMEKVEGYLAHKYGIQNDLMHSEFDTERFGQRFSRFDFASTTQFGIRSQNFRFPNTFTSTVGDITYTVNPDCPDTSLDTVTNAPTAYPLEYEKLNNPISFYQDFGTFNRRVALDLTGGANSSTTDGGSYRMWANSSVLATADHGRQGIFYAPAYRVPVDWYTEQAAAGSDGTLFKEAFDVPRGLKWKLEWKFKSTQASQNTIPSLYYADGSHPGMSWDYIMGANVQSGSADTWGSYSHTFDLSTSELGVHTGANYRECPRNIATKIFIGFACDIPGQHENNNIWEANWLDQITLTAVPTEHPYKHQPPPAVGANTTPY